MRKKRLKDYTEKQQEEIQLGLESGVDVSIYDKKKYNGAKMEQIRLMLENKIQNQKYIDMILDEEIDAETSMKIRCVALYCDVKDRFRGPLDTINPNMEDWFSKMKSTICSLAEDYSFTVDEMSWCCDSNLSKDQFEALTRGIIMFEYDENQVHLVKDYIKESDLAQVKSLSYYDLSSDIIPNVWLIGKDNYELCKLFLNPNYSLEKINNISETLKLCVDEGLKFEDIKWKSGSKEHYEKRMNALSEMLNNGISINNFVQNLPKEYTSLQLNFINDKILANDNIYFHKNLGLDESMFPYIQKVILSPYFSVGKMETMINIMEAGYSEEVQKMVASIIDESDKEAQGYDAMQDKTIFKNYGKELIEIINEDLKEGIDITKYINSKDEQRTILQVREAMEDGFDMSKYIGKGYSSGQIKAIVKGLNDGIDVSLYDDINKSGLEMMMTLISVRKAQSILDSVCNEARIGKEDIDTDIINNQNDISNEDTISVENVNNAEIETEEPIIEDDSDVL